jgi:hypothetical protein
MLSEALRIAATASIGSARAAGLSGLAPHLAKSEPLLAEALSVAEAIEDWLGFTMAMEGLAPHLSSALLQRALKSASAHLRVGSYRVRAVAALASRLPPGTGREAALVDALQAAEAIEGTLDRIEALRILVPHLHVTVQERAAVALMQSAGGVARVHLLEAVPMLVDVVGDLQDDRELLEVHRAVRDAGRWFA